MRRVLIAGCGYVGRETARLFSEAGWDVTGLVRSEESVSLLSGAPFRVLSCDISDASATRDLLPDYKGSELVIHCASSSRGGADSYRRVYLEGARNLMALQPAKFIFTSSTSVYPQENGECVTEDSAANPERETGQILRETEDLVLAHAGGIVARLAGIYGPGRSILLKRFFEGNAVIEGQGERLLNQIHRDDAASALYSLGTNGSTSGIYNVSDDQPLSQLECYSWLAEHFHRPIPPFGPVDTERKRGVTSKRVSNARLKEIGWQPRFTSFMRAVAEDKDLLAGNFGSK